MTTAIQMGINMTTAEQIELVKRFRHDGDINYVELLIDNFFDYEPESIAEALEGFPVALHIMFSRFLEREPQELKKIAQHLRSIINMLNPIYVSDHIARFSEQGVDLIRLAEFDYQQVAFASEKIQQWQDLLDCRLYLENYPSYHDTGIRQIDFLQHIMLNTQCGILFDFSNAVIASHNVGFELNQWLPILQSAQHCHAGGFSPSRERPELLIDSHDKPLDRKTYGWLAALQQQDQLASVQTLTVEFDHAIDEQAWQADIRDARHFFQTG